VEFVEDEPQPRAKPGTTKDGKQVYSEQTLTTEEMESGIRVLDLSEGLGEGIRRARVVVEEKKSPEEPEEEELEDPVVVEAEETYLQEFDTDNSHQDTAMKEAGGDWIQMPAEKKKKKHDKAKFVGDQAYKYVKMKR
jgi:hypothetical protein